jgi:uncharacterized GH25 family protein
MVEPAGTVARQPPPPNRELPLAFQLEQGMTQRIPILIGAAATLVLTSASAEAHSVWITQRAGDWAVVYGHGSSDDEYEIERVTAAAAVDAAGAPTEARVAPSGKIAIFEAPEEAALLMATFDHGYWTEDAAGDWHNLPPNEVEGAKSAGRYLNYAVAIVADGESPLQAKPLGLGLEIVPLADPRSLAAGDDLPVQLLREGAPVEGVELDVEYLTGGDLKTARTDAEGQTIVTIRNVGLNVVNAYYELPPAEGETAVLGLGATLSFVAGPDDEEE